MESKNAFDKGYAQGYKFGMFCRHNPYDPNKHPEQFQEWEEGFSKGYQDKGWL
ncbi:hypothetical protein [Escherichia phage phiWec179]|jgi:ribosome modulation factor|nr:hypothetical protein [Escherichia phage phiWec179]BDU12371.1 hypothetical protein [Escherichia phage phiWec181]BDU12811.1 hypothetical protein [Escherichia phage phiWec186]